MIPAEDYLKQRNIYMKRGSSSMWKVLGYCDSPSVTMVNLETGERESFGILGATANEYMPVPSLTYDYENGGKIIEKHEH